MTRVLRRIGVPTAGLVLLCGALLTGCSQIAAIAPVGGDRLAEVRYAGNDVLVTEGVEILTAPVCTQGEDSTVSCTGRALDGSPITVTSAGADPTSITVMVGEDTLYEGSLQDVLEKGSTR